MSEIIALQVGTIIKPYNKKIAGVVINIHNNRFLLQLFNDETRPWTVGLRNLRYEVITNIFRQD